MHRPQNGADKFWKSFRILECHFLSRLFRKVEPPQPLPGRFLIYPLGQHLANVASGHFGTESRIENDGLKVFQLIPQPRPLHLYPFQKFVAIYRLRVVEKPVHQTNERSGWRI